MTLERPKRRAVRIGVLPGSFSASAGGACRSACLHASSLAGRGMEVSVFGLTENGDMGIQTDLPLEGCRVTSHDSTMTGLSLWSDSFLDDLNSSLSDIDVLHINGNFNALHYEAARLASRAGVPYIISPRAELDPSHLNQTEPDRVIHLARYEAEYVEGAHALHFTSDLETSRARIIGKQKNVLKVPNAVDISHLKEIPDQRAARARLGIDNDELVVLYFGRMISQKRPKFIVETMARLEPERKINLYLVGDCLDDMKVELCGIAERHGIADRINIISHVSGTAKAAWFSAADILVVPSDAENFSLALVEGVASGLRCLVSPRIGATEYLDGTDFEALELDLDKWAARLSLTQPKAGSRSARRKESYTRLERRFSPGALAERWSQIYDAI